MTDTLTYYNKNAATFAAGTVDVDFAQIQDLFLEYLPEGGKILDFGCGSGRDTAYFLRKGYEVDATDGSPELCEIASEYTGITVRQMLFEELDEREVYDGIWACASILHVEKAKLPDILKRMAKAVKENGTIYVSFKYGDFEGMKDGRYFTYLTEERFGELVKEIPELRIEKLWVSGDVRAGRGDEMWLNMILGKDDVGYCKIV
jgi:SAM-dependent methyltransferase